MEKRTVKQLKACFEDKVQDLKYEHLVVHGLESSVNDADLREYFEQFGKVAVAKVREDVSLQVLGFVIIRYSDYEVQKKVQSMKHTIKTHEVDVTFQRYDKRYKHLIVHSLPSSISGADLKEYFEKFGEVVLSEVREDLKAAETKGFVIMCIASFDEIREKKHVIEAYELVVAFQGPLNILAVEIAVSKDVEVNNIQGAVDKAIAEDPRITQNWAVVVTKFGDIAPSTMGIVQIFSTDTNLDQIVVEVALQTVRSSLKSTLVLTKQYTGNVHPIVVVNSDS